MKALSNSDSPYEYGTLLNEENLVQLTSLLDVQWPSWFYSLVITLLSRSKDYGDWLPGGFLYLRPALIYRDTNAFRNGTSNLRQLASDGVYTVVSWQKSLIIVGGTGGGSVVINVTSAQPIFYLVSNDDDTLAPFINVLEVSSSVDDFSKKLIRGSTGG